MRSMLWPSVFLGSVLFLAGCNNPPITPPATTLAISPKTVTRAANGSTQAFLATLNGTGTVNWQLDSALGVLSSTTGSSVTYTPPTVSTTTDRTVKLTAKLMGTSASEAATITISGTATPPPPAPTLAISPKTVTLSAGGTTQAFTATTNPTGAVNWQLDSALGTLSSTTGSSVIYTPPAVAITTDRTVNLTATLQGTSATDTSTITISGTSTPPPPLPSVTNPGSQAHTVGNSVNLPIQASGTGTLAYSATGLPDGLSIDASSGIISGAPTTIKSYTPQVTVSDTNGSSNVSFAWNVTEINGLVGWWKFNEGSGTLAADSSGYGNDGTILNGGFGAGKVGGALEMDGGNNSIVSIPISDSLRTTDKKITVMAWAYLNDWNHVDILGHSYPFVFFGFHNEKNGSGNPTKKAFKWQVATSSQDVDRATVFAEADAGQPMNLGTWYHLAGTYDGTTVKLYVNGQAFGFDVAFSQVLPMPNTDFTISGYREPDKNAFDYNQIKDEINGKIDDVRLYNRALSAAEILDIYNSQK